MSSLVNRHSFAAIALSLVVSSVASAQSAVGQKPFEPVVGQAGKDVVWVPTPEVLVERMLDVAKVTPQDYVMDLGSGDGRNVIAAAKRGARALGVEYNQDMVDLSRRRAEEAGVGGPAGKAQFVQGDMYVADISQASVMALFLLPQNMLQLRDKFAALKPGSRIVSNTFGIENWEPDYTETVPNCPGSWCNVLLWIVPAPISGTWQTPQGEMTIVQQFQKFSGTVGKTPLTEGKINGEQVTFLLDGNKVTASARGDVLEGTIDRGDKATSWRATRAPK
jgi:SAM-dependent methyltransferase